MQKHTKLGQLLLRTGTVQEWQFLAAMGARRPGQKLGDVMISKGFLTEDQLLDALSLQLEIPRITLAGMTIDPDSVKAMPGHVARRFTVFPVAIKPSHSDLDVPTLGQPEAFVHVKEGLFDENGRLASEGTRKFLQGWTDRWVAWVKKHAGV